MSLEDKIREELRTVADQVVYILSKYPETRNSDTYLEWIWMRQFAGVDLPWIEYQKVQEFSLETVRRNRAKIQSSGLFPPTNQEVIDRRKLKQKIYHDEFSPPPPEFD